MTDTASRKVSALFGQLSAADQKSVIAFSIEMHSHGLF